MAYAAIGGFAISNFGYARFSPIHPRRSIPAAGAQEAEQGRHRRGRGDSGDVQGSIGNVALE
jgi:hypothetical protein